MPLVVPSTVPVTVLHALSKLNNVNIEKIVKLRITSEFYHNFSDRTISVLAMQNLTFQFKLLANNATKFGAPGNRTPLKKTWEKYNGYL